MNMTPICAVLWIQPMKLATVLVTKRPYFLLGHFFGVIQGYISEMRLLGMINFNTHNELLLSNVGTKCAEVT